MIAGALESTQYTIEASFGVSVFGCVSRRVFGEAKTLKYSPSSQVAMARCFQN
jgi:hypothetical protein